MNIGREIENNFKEPSNLENYELISRILLEACSFNFCPSVQLPFFIPSDLTLALMPKN